MLFINNVTQNNQIIESKVLIENVCLKSNSEVRYILEKKMKR